MTVVLSACCRENAEAERERERAPNECMADVNFEVGLSRSKLTLVLSAIQQLFIFIQIFPRLQWAVC